DEPALVEPTDDAAQVAGIEAELAAQLTRRHRVTVRQLVEHAALGQRERTGEIALVEQADLLRVETVEAPHRGHPLLHLLGGRLRRGAAPRGASRLRPSDRPCLCHVALRRACSGCEGAGATRRAALRAGAPAVCACHYPRDGCRSQPLDTSRRGAAG